MPVSALSTDLYQLTMMAGTVALLPPAFRELSTPVEYEVERSDRLSEALTC